MKISDQYRLEIEEIVRQFLDEMKAKAQIPFCKDVTTPERRALGYIDLEIIGPWS